MEWIKAKNILIIVFLILDIFLVYKIISSGDKIVTVTGDDIRECRQILKANNIKLDAKVPSKVKPLSNLQVYNSIYKDNKLKNKLFNSKMLQEHTSQADIYVDRHMRTTIDKYDDSLENIDNYYSKGFNCLDTKERILKKANEVLKNKGIDTSNSRIERFSRSRECVKIDYEEIYEGFRISNSYIKLKIDKTGLVIIDYKWYVTREFSDNQEKLVSPIDAIILVMNHMSDSKNQSIKSIDIDYYIEDNGRYIMDAEAIPVWRIVTDSKVYYINAYENSIAKTI